MRVRSLIIGLTTIFILGNQTALADPRIIGGIRANPGDWPWMVALIKADKVPFDGQYCGGTLVHPYWVLTAAHCTEDKQGVVYQPEEIFVVVGRTKLSEIEKGETLQVAEIIRHPDYDNPDPARPPKDDLALLKLQTPSQQPILKLTDEYAGLTKVGEKGIVMGWGTTNPNGQNYPDDLYQTEVPFVSHELCNSQRSYPDMITGQMLCAGYLKGGKDACVGDSGGPLIVETEFGPKQVGIVSYGEGCALPNYYGIYTRLESFQNFVTEHICSDITVPIPEELKTNMTGYQATVTWRVTNDIEGYLFYYAPFSQPINAITLDNISSLDIGFSRGASATLQIGKTYYVAVRAYQGNCLSPYSNLGLISAPAN